MFNNNAAIQQAVEDYMNMEKKRKLLNYKRQNELVLTGQIVFTGSSLMEQFPITELSLDDNIDSRIYNRGISGYTTDEFIEGIGPMCLDLKPSKLFINIGTNDMNTRDDGEYWLDHLLKNYDIIMERIATSLPETEVYVMAYYPVNEYLIQMLNTPASIKLKTRTNHKVAMANQEVHKLAHKHGFNYVDLNDGLTDEYGQLKPEYTVEGIHLFANAYNVVYNNLKKLELI